MLLLSFDFGEVGGVERKQEKKREILTRMVYVYLWVVK
jgi:hypothetical protein